MGALAGRGDVMDVFKIGGTGPHLPQSGTFSANPVSMGAGLIAMEAFDIPAVARLNKLGQMARDRIREEISRSGLPACVTGTGSLFRIHFKSSPPTDYRSAYPTPNQKKALDQFIDGLFDNGVLVIYSSMGSLSTPMGDEEIDRLGAAVRNSLQRVDPGLLSS